MYLSYKSFINKPSNINEIAVKSTEEVPISNNSFAIMLENTTGGFTTSVDRTQWPNTSQYVYYLTECYDGDGKISESTTATFNASTKKFTLSTDTSSYCNIKFANKNGPMGKLLTNPYFETEEARQQNRPNDTLRRFQGTKDQVNNNYICFGTNVTKTCVDTPGTYMYRIIGLVSQTDSVTGEKVGMLKIIKKEALDTAYKWNNETGDYYRYQWVRVTLYKQLNGIDTGSPTTYPSDIFLTNTTYVPNTSVGNKTWKDIIVDIKWRYGASLSDIHTASGADTLANEKTWTDQTEPSKIGLMDLSDYYLAYDNSRNWYSVYDRNSWIHLENNDSTPPYPYEWTQQIGNGYVSYSILSSGQPMGNGQTVTYAYSVRPVFYLISSVQLKGTGTIDDPYIIVSA